MIKRLFVSLLTALATIAIHAQIVTISPTFATQNDEVTVIFDATLGNAGLTNVVPVYAHTGVILQGQQGWQHVQGNWGTADPNVVMTPMGNNLHKMTFNIAEFYNLQPGDVVEKLAFVFRNATGSKEGKTADGQDIFVDIYTSDFAAKIIAPFEPQVFFETPSNLEFTAAANQTSDFTLYLNNDVLATAPATTTHTTHVDFTGMPTAQYWLKAEVNNGSQTVKDSVYVIVQGDPQVAQSPQGIKDGINYIDDHTVILQIYAPYKDFVYVLGDFNDWEFNPDYFMKITPEGDRYWLQINNLNPGQEYRFQYSINQEDMRVADIYADKILDPWNDPYIPASVYPNLISYPTGLTTEIVSVLQTAQTPFNWQVENFERPDERQLVIYELLIRDWHSSHSYKSVTDKLDYLQNLGVNAIQLLPFTEFEGNESWGYNPMFYFAPDKYYGTKNDLKTLIDEAHQRGIAVIQDVVFNHSFGQNPQLRMYSQSGGPSGPPSENSPYFNVNATHPFNVGYDYNHSLPAVQEFVKRNLQYWVEEYKIDGFRFDLSKGFTQNVSTSVGQWNQYDQERINNWFRIRDEIHSYDPNVYMILEHLGNNDEETVLANGGLMLWGNLNHEYNEATMGYNSNLSWGDYQTRGWNEPKLVTYAESHDEERLMYKNLQYGNVNGSYNIKNLQTALTRQELAAAFLIPLAGPKMIWQFGELGYDYSINYCPDGTLSENCRTANKPIRWDYFDEPARQRLYKVYAALNNLKTQNDAFLSTNYTWDAGGKGKRLIITHPQMDVVIIGNFDVVPISMVPGFTHTGTWYDYMQGTSIIEENLNNAFLLQPGEYRIYTSQPLPAPDLSVGLTDTDGYAAINPLSLSVYPNPFQYFTQISYTIQSSGPASATIYDLGGRRVKSLLDTKLSPGHYTLTWNGHDDDGTHVPGGVYILKLQSNTSISTAKIAVIK